jgi:hypothetical protein
MLFMVRVGTPKNSTQDKLVSRDLSRTYAVHRALFDLRIREAEAERNARWIFTPIPCIHICRASNGLAFLSKEPRHGEVALNNNLVERMLGAGSMPH